MPLTRKAAQCIAFLVPTACLLAVSSGSEELSPAASVALITAALGISSFSLAGLYCTHQVRLLRQGVAHTVLLRPACLPACALCCVRRVKQGCQTLCQATYSLRSIHRTSPPQDLSPKYSSALLGLTNTAGAIPGIVGVAATGLIYDATGSWASSLFLPTAFFLTTGAAVYTLLGSNEAEDFDAEGMDAPFEWEGRARALLSLGGLLGGGGGSSKRD